MGNYGEVAIRATELVRAGRCGSPAEAWSAAAQETFPGKVPSQEKSCPKGAYLGLCEEGMVAGVPAGRYTTSRNNKRYAVTAARLLQADPSLSAEHPVTLWRKVLRGEEKRSNHQMEVVLALWKCGLIRP